MNDDIRPLLLLREEKDYLTDLGRLCVTMMFILGGLLWIEIQILAPAPSPAPRPLPVEEYLEALESASVDYHDPDDDEHGMCPDLATVANGVER